VVPSPIYKNEKREQKYGKGKVIKNNQLEKPFIDINDTKYPALFLLDI